MKMLRQLLILGIVIFYVPLLAINTGTIRFIKGEVLYRPNTNAQWRVPKIKETVEMNGTIKTGIDSSVEILWNDNTISKLEAKREFTIKTLWDLAHDKKEWTGQVKDKINSFCLQQKNRAEVAGIRKEEAEVKTESELFWDVDPLVDVFDAVELMEKKEYITAIPLFEKVIEQAPLNKDAELALACLILIYSEQKDPKLMSKYIGILKQDFPQSTFIESLPAE